MYKSSCMNDGLVVVLDLIMHNIENLDVVLLNKHVFSLFKINEVLWI